MARNIFGVRAHVGVGASTGSASVAAGGSTTFTLAVKEACVLDYIVVACSAIENLVIDAIRVDNETLTSGEVPAGLFSADSVRNPRLGYVVNQSSTIEVDVTNRHASAAVQVGVGMLTSSPAMAAA